MFYKNYVFQVPVRFHSGYGSFHRLGCLAESIGNNFLLITGKHSMKRTGHTKLAISQFEALGKKVFLFEEAAHDADTSIVARGAGFALENECDAVIGLGGGSVIDTAKAVAVIAGNGGEIWDYSSNKKDASRTLPVIAVPTTAGSGSEGNRYFVISDKEKKIKKVFATGYTYPALSILDGSLTESLPQAVLAGSALDALGHSFEAYVSIKENALGDLLSLNSIWIIFNYLPEVLKSKGSRGGRSALMLAAAMGGIAIDSGGVGAAHAIVRALGGLYGLASSQATGIILPYTIEKARPAIDNKLSFMARFLGWSRKDNIAGNARLVIEKLYSFTRDIGFPKKLGKIGVKKENIAIILDKILADEDLINDPGSYTRKEAKKFLEKII